MNQPQKLSGILGFFINHPVIANALMLLMIGAGFFSVKQLNVQFFPDFEVEVLAVTTVWNGASSSDVESSITNIIEQKLDGLADVKSMFSTSSLGISTINLEYEIGTDMISAQNEVTQKIAEIRNLPIEAETPIIQQWVEPEQVANLVITGENVTYRELRLLADQYISELKEAGVTETKIKGLPELELQVEVSLSEINSGAETIQNISSKIARQSSDSPSGSIGESHGVRNLRIIEQRKNEVDLQNLYYQDEENQPVAISSKFPVKLKPEPTSSYYVNGNPAVQIVIAQADNQNTLDIAEKFMAWHSAKQNEIPSGVELIIYDESWRLVKSRLDILLDNGTGGIILVALVLFLFLNSRVAFWVAVGIPISFLMGLYILYQFGGSINMISMFGLIMALGIVVDDAIVVGESMLHNLEKGQAPIDASYNAARRMFVPVFAAVLTTIAAFLPMMWVDGIIGSIIFDIPFVIITVLIAAMLECFLVLPHHLKSSFKSVTKQSKVRMKLENGFNYFRDRIFEPLVEFALHNRLIALCTVMLLLLVAAGLIAGGRIGFVFFPSVPSPVIIAEVRFESATPVETVNKYLLNVESKAKEIARDSGEDLIRAVVVERFNEQTTRGGKITFELLPNDERNMTNLVFNQKVRDAVGTVPGLQVFKIAGRAGGPPGQDVEIKISGSDVSTLKRAALELQEAVKSIPGTLNVEDDLPYGRDSLVFTLTDVGYNNGFSVSEVSSQVRQMLNGATSYTYADQIGSQDVVVILKESERNNLDTLNKLFVKAPNGQLFPLESVVNWQYRKDFDSLKHIGGELTIKVLADVDASINTPNNINDSLAKNILPDLREKYGVKFSFEGASATQKETMDSMVQGAQIGLLVMYLILVIILGSWSTPFFVMIAIPFGLIGAILGHYIMNLEMTILSLFGFFALTGIVVNNSIIYVTTYNRHRSDGMHFKEALHKTSLERLRPILVTSLTTIGGLLPLTFETSLQAMFLIPMAVSISFGLMISTFLVLIMLPVMLSLHEEYIISSWTSLKSFLFRKQSYN